MTRITTSILPLTDSMPREAQRPKKPPKRKRTAEHVAKTAKKLGDQPPKKGGNDQAGHEGPLEIFGWTHEIVTPRK